MMVSIPSASVRMVAAFVAIESEGAKIIVDALHEMQIAVRELARQFQSGEFSLYNGGYEEN